MSGETTNYLGIILAVAGLFFVVVVASIFMSCYKCCRKQIKRTVLPPEMACNYGSTHKNNCKKTHNKKEEETHNKKEKAEQDNARLAKHRRTQQSRSQDYTSLDTGQERPAADADSGSMPDLLQGQEKSEGGILKRLTQFYSFDSMPSHSVPSLGESTRTSSGDAAWLTPDEDNHIFYTLPRRQQSDDSW